MINTLLAGVLAFSAAFFLYRVLRFVAAFFVDELIYFDNFRPKFNVRVNCWFCNVNQWVPYQQKNSFMCKKCDQYNGFDKDGDYNKFIASQRVETLNMKRPTAKRLEFSTFPSTNGLCEMCNQKQSIIIERLNKFEAVDDVRFEFSISTV